MPKVVPSQVVEYIENTFPIVTDEARYTKIDVTTARISALRTVIELTESIPSELIAVDGPDFIDFTSGVMALKGTISQWESRGERRGNLPFVEGRGQKTGLDLVREVLQKCPDSAPSPETGGLEFIDDAVLRISLRLDWSSANGALAEGEWKSATVMAGSIIEALLLWAIEKRPIGERKNAIVEIKKKGTIRSEPNPDRLEDRSWGLHEYTEVAAQLHLISDQAAIQVRQTREFRNLIHPAAAIRTQRECSRGTALAALSAVEFVAFELAQINVGIGIST